MRYQAELDQATKNKQSNQKILKRINKKKNDLDTLFSKEHDTVFSKMDCLTCGNCCKTTSPIFKETDIKRIAKNLRVKPAKFIEEHLHIDEDNDYVLNSSPCTFLNEDNTCFIYDYRPQACREYPHTNRKKMSQILNLTLENTMVCPAVARIVENLKEKI